MDSRGQIQRSETHARASSHILNEENPICPGLYLPPLLWNDYRYCFGPRAGLFGQVLWLWGIIIGQGTAQPRIIEQRSNCLQKRLFRCSGMEIYCELTGVQISRPMIHLAVRVCGVRLGQTNENTPGPGVSLGGGSRQGPLLRNSRTVTRRSFHFNLLCSSTWGSQHGIRIIPHQHSIAPGVEERS